MWPGIDSRIRPNISMMGFFPSGWRANRRISTFEGPNFFILGFLPEDGVLIVEFPLYIRQYFEDLISMSQYGIRESNFTLAFHNKFPIGLIN